MKRIVSSLLWLLLPIPLTLAADQPKPTTEQYDYFEKNVRPIFAEKCNSCHGEKKQQAGLRLDTAEGLKKGADDGPVLVAGEPNKSKLIHSVRRSGDSAMPPDGDLSREQVGILEQWVTMGAPYPASALVAKTDTSKTHWAFQPIQDPAVPASKVTPIDAFIEAKLASHKLIPSPRADKRTLARRLYFDLVGLPPTAAEVDSFANDADPKAYEKLIDKLLASPQYGERWGRYWMDVARYADSKGYVFNEDRNYPYAYTYRDYLIRSFNDDKPFDRFIIEQLAADKLTLGDDKKPLAAMGFLTVGRRFSNNFHDITDDRIDVVTRGFMGLTVSCARCHDHKFDPVPTADYYSLYGVFASSHEPKDLPQISDPENTKEYERFQAELGKLERAVSDERQKRLTTKKIGLNALASGLAFQPNEQKLLNRGDKNELINLQKKVDELKSKSPANPPRAMVLNDNTTLGEQVVFLRGNPGNPGPKVPRQLPTIADANRKPFTEGSGRLEMAKAIASKENPLTARVLVNRIWMWHFGQGLVRTPSDFGVRSEPPTHPELLDWLTSRFIQDGWSIKKLHKRILTSETYARSSDTLPEVVQADPENKWLARLNRKRHDFETMRDSLLEAAGLLDRTMSGRSLELFKAPFSHRRSVYASIDRQNLPGTLRAFDFASPEQHTPQRFVTTVPQQSLFLMNSPFLMDLTRALVKQADVATATDKATAIYRRILNRNPTEDERNLAENFVTTASQSEIKPGPLSAWEQLAQVLLLSNEFAFVD
jgi:mono/diheme cytochrome c family protein